MYATAHAWPRCRAPWRALRAFEVAQKWQVITGSCSVEPEPSRTMGTPQFQLFALLPLLLLLYHIVLPALELSTLRQPRYMGCNIKLFAMWRPRTVLLLCVVRRQVMIVVVVHRKTKRRYHIKSGEVIAGAGRYKTTRARHVKNNPAGTGYTTTTAAVYQHPRLTLWPL